jgi:hypothetical protein
MNTHFLTPTEELININKELNDVWKKSLKEEIMEGLMEILMERLQEMVKQNVQNELKWYQETTN